MKRTHKHCMCTQRETQDRTLVSKGFYHRKKREQNMLCGKGTNGSGQTREEKLTSWQVVRRRCESGASGCGGGSGGRAKVGAGPGAGVECLKRHGQDLEWGQGADMKTQTEVEGCGYSAA